MKNLDVFQACFDNICKNYNLPAGLHVSKPIRDHTCYNDFIIFIDLHMASHILFAEKEALKNILKTGIKPKKNYRKLRSLIRMRLINTLHELHDLTEESLRNLGAKI